MQVPYIVSCGSQGCLLAVQVAPLLDPLNLGNNGNVMRRHVQLVGGGPHLGEQVVGVVQLGAGPAVLMGDGAPFWSQ